ncbi:unnamed protein product [Clonostachys rosea]|uniref:AAA+ ATPase domain-containing protein n=1 Tax=Bionectria ochroleuca TaxID=29856 RepID=A0ABY6UJR5_BIOOC|nr:unnamed protein product [Clonostachys rosea]
MHEKCDQLFSQGLVTLETLPWLFQPNEMVVSRQGPLVLAHVLWKFPIERQQLVLQCWNWGYNGHWLRRKDTELTVDISTYDEVKIQDLAVFPIIYASEAIKKRLQDNGNAFWRLKQKKLVSYEGLDYRGERIYSELSPDFLMLLPPGIHGFILKEKKWVHLLVHQIRPVCWNKVAFDQLVLPKRTKKLIKGLVMVRKPTGDGSKFQSGFRGKRDDIIAGKGSGLIMLLHGGPGTGKTLTAAEEAEMPLYSVTCGDIGTSPEAVEKYLDSVLHLGKTWNCILLLDEADVFLEERSLSDLERNSLVSVFLRTLEYYDGILILTSNRVGTFDEAFKSRIQLALHYSPLDAPGRRKIWRNLLNMLREDNEDMDYDDIDAHIKQLEAYELNGRQIRNALTTARQLAFYEKETLDWDRIKDSIDVASEFNQYLKEVHGHTDEEWNRENNVR